MLNVFNNQHRNIWTKFALSIYQLERIMESNINLQDDFKYFIEHHDEIFSQYPNKFVVIQNKQIILAETSIEKALESAVSKGLEIGTFIIQECTEGDSAYTQTFHSRVIFA